MTGTPEMAWHLVNINWDVWFENHKSFHKDFGDVSTLRVWKYVYDPSSRSTAAFE